MDEKAPMILDVGCGDHARGTVNCDLNIGHTLQGGDQTKIGIIINPRAIPNFVRCEATNLPFRDRAFDRVVSFHIIEHLPKPSDLVGELLRVSRGEVEIRCPHRYSLVAKMPHHLHYFDRKTFIHMLRSLGIEKYRYTHTYHDRSPFGRLGRILPALRIQFPDEIQVVFNVPQFSFDERKSSH